MTIDYTVAVVGIELDKRRPHLEPNLRQHPGLDRAKAKDADWYTLLNRRYLDGDRAIRVDENGRGDNPFAKPPAVLGRLKAVERILE